jgi:hypothetical protein
LVIISGPVASAGKTIIIAGGMERSSQGPFTEHGIKLSVGAWAETPEKTVASEHD